MCYLNYLNSGNNDVDKYQSYLMNVLILSVDI